MCSANDKWEAEVFKAFDRFLASEDSEQVPGKSSCPLCYQGTASGAVDGLQSTPHPDAFSEVLLTVDVTRTDNKCAVCKFHHDWIVPAAREQFKYEEGAVVALFCALSVSLSASRVMFTHPARMHIAHGCTPMPVSLCRSGFVH